MKTFVSTLIALLTALSFVSATPNDTTEVKPFVITINIDKSDEVLVTYQNAAQDVQITLIESEEGIVFVERAESKNYEHHFPTQKLTAGSYTLLVEYNGRPVKSHNFTIE